MSLKPVSMRVIQQQKKERVANYYIDQLFIASHFNSEEYHSAHTITQYQMEIKPKLSLNSIVSKIKRNSPKVDIISDDSITRTDLKEMDNQFSFNTEKNYIPSIEEKIVGPPISDKIKCRSSRGIDITHYLVQGKY